MRLPAALHVLHNRDYRLYWAGQAISLTGTWMQVMAQSWVVTGLSRSASVLGALNVVSTLPILLLSVVGGTLADHREKRRILIVTQIGMMLLAFTLAGLVFAEGIALWHVFLIATLLGVVTAFDLPAAQAFPPELVRRDEIPQAVALMQAIFHGSRLVGPALAGILVAQFGEGSAFLANGLSFLAVIATLLLIPDRQRPAGEAGARPRGGMGAGFRYVRAEPVVGKLMLLTAITMIFVFPYLIVLMVYYARHFLATDARGMGAVMSASGLGALTGAIVLLFGTARTLRRWLFIGVLGCSAGLFGLALTRQLAVAVVFVACLSFSVSSLMGRISQTIQHRVPNELRGRVMGIFAMTFTGLLPYAALLLSTLSDLIGFDVVLRICSLSFAVISCALLTRLPAAPATHDEPAPEKEPVAA